MEHLILFNPDWEKKSIANKFIYENDLSHLKKKKKKKMPKISITIFNWTKKKLFGGAGLVNIHCDVHI